MPLEADQQGLVREVLRSVDALDAAGSTIVADEDTIYTACKDAARRILQDRDTPRRLMFPLVTDYLGQIEETLTGNAVNLVVYLPSDFLRLMELQVYQHTAPIYQTDIIEQPHEEYRAEVKGGNASGFQRKATIDRPKAFLVYNDPTGQASYVGSEALDIFPGTEGVAEALAIGSTTPTYLAGAGQTIVFDAAIPRYLPSGAVLTASNGSTLTLTAAALKGATSVVGDVGGTSISGALTYAHTKLLEAFQYIPVTPPEDFTDELKEPLRNLAAHLVFVGIDPEMSFLMKRQYDAVMERLRLPTRSTSTRRAYPL